MQDACTVNQTVKYLTKKWTLLIILDSTRARDIPAGSPSSGMLSMVLPKDSFGAAEGT